MNPENQPDTLRPPQSGMFSHHLLNLNSFTEEHHSVNISVRPWASFHSISGLYAVANALTPYHECSTWVFGVLSLASGLLGGVEMVKQWWNHRSLVFHMFMTRTSSLKAQRHKSHNNESFSEEVKSSVTSSMSLSGLRMTGSTAGPGGPEDPGLEMTALSPSWSSSAVTNLREHLTSAPGIPHRAPDPD